MLITSLWSYITSKAIGFDIALMEPLLTEKMLYSTETLVKKNVSLCMI